MTAADVECEIPDCVSPGYCKGWCRRHYAHWVRHGDPLLPLRPTEAERFWAKVDKTDTCWNWTGCRDRLGYGQLNIARGRNAWAHRWAYEYENGPIPEGLVLDHLCRNPSCVRPAHLEAVTHAENMRRGLSGWNNRAKTHCPQGHPYDAENTYLATRSGGTVHRHCIACSRERNRARRQRLKEVAV